MLVACAEVPISSIGTWKARHHRKRIRSRGSGDTPSSVIPLFTRKKYLFMWASLHVGGQSTCLMTSWSRSPAHVRDATGLVPSTTSCSCFPTQAPLNACLLVAQLLARTVVGRIGEPDDIAHLVSYLASKEAGFITGEHGEY